jgi:hypothetical protein
MKKKITFAFFMAFSFLTGNIALAQNAELQVIHNCADPVADSVDVYVNGTLALDNFAFRTATPFLTLPAGVDINVGIAAKTSTSVTDTLVNFVVNLADGNRYIAIASGVLDPNIFALNPENRSTAFTLNVAGNIRNAAANGSDVDFIVEHGSTDAPAVDVALPGTASTLVANAAYLDITNYLTVPPASYVLNIRPAGSEAIVASYVADLSTLGGGSAVVFASGFLDPAPNQNGAAFGLFAALANGTVVEFPLNTKARLQVIHNAADPGAAAVDVYLNGNLLLDDFAFRTATPFIDAPAGVTLDIGIAPPTSTSVNDTLVNIPLTLQAGETYIAIANGVLNPAAFAANPDGRATAFQLLIKTAALESAASPTDVSFSVLHGSTDAPVIDVLVDGPTNLVQDAGYTDITNYITVPAADYLLDITPGSNNGIIVASFNAPLSSLGGGSAFVFASGFLDPTVNQNGAAFGLFAALANGTVVAFPNTTGVNEINSFNSAVFPNPATNSLMITTELNSSEQALLTINDFSGRIVKSMPMVLAASNTGSIDVSDLDAGSYTYSIEIGNKRSTSKFVVIR